MLHRGFWGRYTILAVVLLAAIGTGGWPAQALAQVSPDESAKLLKPADGLEATLWAAESMLSNPTNIDIDSRGRVWVAEGLNYRLTRGGNHKFPRVEEADRIKILEDTDADGKADKVTVFADRIFPVPMGIAVEEHFDKNGKYTGCRVFVGNSPDLLVLEDTDGDDKADKRYPLLTGFGGIDSDHGVHGMAFGLDGKLYFTHGDGCCSVQHDHSERPQNFDVIDRSGRHVWSDQLANTLRVNRDGTQFEIVCDRQRNNYETSLNSFGNVFTSDNDDDGNRGCRVIWAMDGGHYGYKTPGSPRHWGEEVPGNVPKLVGTGNGSPCGIMVYEGDLLPSEYHGAVFEVDAGSRQVNHFPLTRSGAAFRTEYKVLLGSDDRWFRPVDACAAPDGSVFVADWYDAGVGGHSFRDQTSGRIYRVAPKAHKATKPQPDFATVNGLVAALKSPNVATMDAARRLLIERKSPEVGDMAVHETNPIHRARALWTWQAIEGDSVAVAMLVPTTGGRDPRIREQAVRMLGRDCRENGRVEYQKPDAKRPPAALSNLETLLPMADDPDAGVRRELILAFRNLPTDKVGKALRKLTAAWDGEDRWYLEALGLALEKRESVFLTELFDGTLYGSLESSAATKVMLPPYFPVDRNEAYIKVGTSDLPATALSKYLGLAWRIHSREVLPLLGRIAPLLPTPELQQALDDILDRMKDPETAEFVAAMILNTSDPAHRRSLAALMSRHLARDWRSAAKRAAVISLIAGTISDPRTREQGIALAAATGDGRYRSTFETLAQDTKATEDVRVAAVDALGSLNITPNRVPEQLIAAIRGKPSSDPVAEAAVRVMALHSGAHGRLTDLLTTPEYPLGLRREALRSLAQLKDGGARVIELVKTKRLSEDLNIEATTLLHSSLDRGVRDLAAEYLPLPKTAAGRPLPPIRELMRREGNADHGRDLFFRAGANSCGTCHRVQGRGQWIGPDLSTIGVKYGRDELLRSILNPSAAIGFSFRSLIVALDDGRLITGLPIEDSPERLVLKTATGERVSIPTSSIEIKRTSDVSLMPEGLAQTMTDEELVDLLSYLATLRRPVSIVGQYQVIGPLDESGGKPRLDPAVTVDLDSSIEDGHGHKLSWRRIDANTEGLVDLTPFTAVGSIDPKSASAGFVCVPVVSSLSQKATLTLDTMADAAVWFNGKPVRLSDAVEGKLEPRTTAIDLPAGSSTLLIRMTPTARSKGKATLVTTLVVDQPVGFSAAESKLSSRTPAPR